MSSLRIIIEGDVEEVAKIAKLLSDAGYTANMNQSIEKKPFMPKAGDICVSERDGEINAVFLATGHIDVNVHGDKILIASIALETSDNVNNPLMIVKDPEVLWYYQEYCRPANEQETATFSKYLANK